MTKEKKSKKVVTEKAEVELTEWQKAVEADLNAMARRSYSVKLLQVNIIKKESE